MYLVFFQTKYVVNNSLNSITFLPPLSQYCHAWPVKDWTVSEQTGQTVCKEMPGQYLGLYEGRTAEVKSGEEQ